MTRQCLGDAYARLAECTRVTVDSVASVTQPRRRECGTRGFPSVTPRPAASSVLLRSLFFLSSCIFMDIQIDSELNFEKGCNYKDRGNGWGYKRFNGAG